MALNPIPDKTNINLPTTPNAKKDSTVNNRSQTTDSKADEIKVSALTQEIRNALDSTSVVNEEKIEALKTALRERKYQVNAESTAEKILQTDLNHLNST